MIYSLRPFVCVCVCERERERERETCQTQASAGRFVLRTQRYNLKYVIAIF